jgi:cysteine desulfurase / selenocysteine lyase
MTITEARRQFAHTWTDMIYLNHAAISPTSFRVREALDKYHARRALKGIESFPWAPKMARETKGLIASLIGTTSDRIAFTLNTAEGLSILAGGLDWQQGDRVLLYSQEYPANVYPFLNLAHRGVAIDFYDADDFRIPAEVIAKHITPNTRLLSVSAVQFLSGYRADLAAIGKLCKEHNIIFCVDAIQAVPHVPINVTEAGIDYLAAGAHKWMMGTEGTAFIYISKALQSHVHQQAMGALSVKDPFRYTDYELGRIREDASRYESGTLNYPGIASLKAALELQQEIGLDAIYTQTLSLTGMLLTLCDRAGVGYVTPKDEAERAGIVSIIFDNATDIASKAQKKGIHIVERGGRLRFSPYFYNTEEEIRTAFNALFD